MLVTYLLQFMFAVIGVQLFKVTPCQFYSYMYVDLACMAWVVACLAKCLVKLYSVIIVSSNLSSLLGAMLPDGYLIASFSSITPKTPYFNI